jgi:hypothetical protein
VGRAAAEDEEVALGVSRDHGDQEAVVTTQARTTSGTTAATSSSWGRLYRGAGTRRDWRSGESVVKRDLCHDVGREPDKRKRGASRKEGASLYEATEPDEGLS